MSDAKRPVEIDDLYELTLVGDAQISPDGQSIAYVHRKIDREKNDYLSSIWLWSDGHSRQYTAGDKDGSPRWSPDGKWLAFQSKRDEDGKARIMLLRTDGGEAFPITDKEWEVSGIEWSPDSSRIAFVRGFKTNEFGEPKDPDAEKEESKGKAKDKKKPAATKITERLAFKGDGLGFIQDKRNHISVIDIESREVTQLTDGDFHDGQPAWSPDGQFIAFHADRNERWDTEIESQIWEVPAAGGDLRRVTIEPGAFDSPIYSPDGSKLAFVGMLTGEGSKITGFAKLWSCNRDGSDLMDLNGSTDIEIGSSSITDTKLDAQEGFYWNEAGIWFLATVEGATNVYRWDSGGIAPVTEGKQEIRGFSVAGSDIAFVRSDLTHLAEVWVKRGGSTPEQLTHVNDAFLEKVTVVTPEPIEFEGSGGETVAGWIMKPLGLASGAKAPLILYIHGGPQAAYGDSFFHEMQMLAGKGFGVLLINPHGSGSRGEEWTSSIHGDWGNRDFEDFMKATDFAESLDWVDESRIGVGGGSYGGYMTSWIIGHTDRYKAALIERAVTNFLSFVGTTDVPNWWKYAWHGTIEDDPMKLWAMSPMAYLKNMVTPSLVIHSENDHRCPIEQGEQIFVGLRKRGVPTRFIRFPEESHGLSRGGKPSRRVERLTEISGWFAKYLNA